MTRLININNHKTFKQYNAYNGLGIVADRPRNILPGTQFEGLFPGISGTDPIVNKNAEVHDTLHFVKTVVHGTLGDTKKLASRLKKESLPATLKNIFDFFYKHYRYKLDKYGVEQVRRPARAWADRKQGIDCDCFTTSVSSLFSNLGIRHYLKIIGIKGRPYFQHIYVVVPKFPGASISTRSDYWVIDPVLNSFDEEAPQITKQDHLEMSKLSGIPLQYLNGLESEVAGLGSEFDNLDKEVNGLGNVNGDAYQKFKGCMCKHVRRTRDKIRRNPGSVSAVYEPGALLGALDELSAAFDGTEENLMGTLERLSAREMQFVKPAFRNYNAAVHGHDDYLYGVMFGDIDDQMIGTVMGLGRKGRSKAKAKAANTGKKGFFTKVKNAVKKASQTKVGKVLKKIGHIVKKTNPLAIAARAGFYLALRTNFAMIAEKAYWGFKTIEEARKAGIKDDYYKKCVELLNKIRKVIINILGGEESTIKKSILNGRAAKKIAKSLKGMGMLGGMEELSGIGALGSAVATGASITAAMSFITPIIAWIKKNFKTIAKVGKAGFNFLKKRQEKKAGKKGEGENGEGIENENGTVSEPPPTDPGEIVPIAKEEAMNPSDSINTNDGSVEAADQANEEAPSDSQSDEEKKKTGRWAAPGTGVKTEADVKAEEQSQMSEEGGGAESGSGNTKKAGGGGTIVLVGAGLALAAIAASKGKASDKAHATSGLGKAKGKKKNKKVKTVKLK